MRLLACSRSSERSWGIALLLLALPTLVWWLPTTASAQQPQPSVSQAPAPSAGTAFFDPTSPQWKQRAELRSELMRTEAALQDLRAGRPRIGGPIALLALGGATGIMTGLIGLGWWANNDQERYGFRANGDRYHYKDPGDHSVVLKLGWFTAVAGVLIVSGGVLLARRLTKRREHNLARSHPLRQRRDELREQLRGGVQVGRGQVSGSVGFAF